MTQRMNPGRPDVIAPSRATDYQALAEAEDVKLRPIECPLLRKRTLGRPGANDRFGVLATIRTRAPDPGSQKDLSERCAMSVIDSLG